MPARTLSVRKLREVLRLRYELELGYQQIGRSSAIAASTVHKVSGLPIPCLADENTTPIIKELFH